MPGSYRTGPVPFADAITFWITSVSEPEVTVCGRMNGAKALVALAGDAQAARPDHQHAVKRAAEQSASTGKEQHISLSTLTETTGSRRAYAAEQTAHS